LERGRSREVSLRRRWASHLLVGRAGYAEPVERLSEDKMSSVRSAVICSFEMIEAVNAGSRDPMGVDGKFLDEISLNAF
jgi:hypothetical protein